MAMGVSQGDGETIRFGMTRTLTRKIVLEANAPNWERAPIFCHVLL